MDAFLAANGPVNIAVLGLGGNGHLGMNEPGSSGSDETRIVALSPATIKAGAAYWGSEAAVPRQGYTLGLKTLLQAQEVLLLVNGAAKAGILAKTLNDQVDPSIPATALRTRSGVTVIADQAAFKP